MYGSVADGEQGEEPPSPEELAQMAGDAAGGGGCKNDPDRGPPPDAKPADRAIKDLARKHGMNRGDLSKVFHRVKRSAGLGAKVDTLVDAEGNVYTENTGEWIGNLFDDV